MKYVALAGEDCPAEALDALRRCDDIADVFVLPPDGFIDSPVATHPDTILFVYKSKLYCHQSYAEKNSALLAHICSLCGLSPKTDSGERNGKYPFDCGYNALYVPAADAVIGNKKALVPPLRDICSIDTKQGYAACCAVAIDKYIVTADPSIRKASAAAELDVFTVPGGDIALRGYSTGFIGGCTGVSDRTVFTVGDPYTCASGTQLADFCLSQGFDVVPLCRTPLTDVGGIKLIPCND